jgi:hypothetical protein
MYIQLVVVAVLVIGWLVFRLANSLPGLWMTSERFNSTEDWTLGPERDAPIKWSTTNLVELGQRIVNAHLEPGETLEGFASAFFSPPRRVDWMPSLRRLQCPLLIAATSRRILMFELDAGMTVTRFRFIGYDNIQYLSPPKPSTLGTSGRLRFGLTSGHEYQVGFLGPLFSDEGMRQEQRLAARLRDIASRFRSSRAPDARAA